MMISMRPPEQNTRLRPAMPRRRPLVIAGGLLLALIIAAATVVLLLTLWLLTTLGFAPFTIAALSVLAATVTAHIILRLVEPLLVPSGDDADAHRP